jgi:hypothetical protein
LTVPISVVFLPLFVLLLPWPWDVGHCRFLFFVLPFISFAFSMTLMTLALSVSVISSSLVSLVGYLQCLLYSLWNYELK